MEVIFEILWDILGGLGFFVVATFIVVSIDEYIKDIQREKRLKEQRIREEIRRTEEDLAMARRQRELREQLSIYIDNQTDSQYWGTIRYVNYPNNRDKVKPNKAINKAKKLISKEESERL